MVQKPSGRSIPNIVFLVVEYVSGPLLFEVCQLMGGMGEDAGRFFMLQLLESVGFLHSHETVHRDLKLENILIDDNMNLHIADFGFACFKAPGVNIHALTSYRGTKTYMAPEIKEGKVYSGVRVDFFSIAVILFILVKGTFPFLEAKQDDQYYSLLIKGKTEQYIKAVGANNLSKNFQDLILRMFNYDPEKRLTIDEIRNHPWLKAHFSPAATKQALLDKLAIRKKESALKKNAEKVKDDFSASKV